MAAEQRRSTIFDIVSKCIVQSVLRDISINSEYIESKAKQLCYCPASKKESVINGIYNCCESNIEIMDKEQLLKYWTIFDVIQLMYATPQISGDYIIR